MGLTRTVSEINGAFGQKLHILSHTRVFIAPPPPAKGFSLEFCNGSGAQRLEWCPYQNDKIVSRYVACAFL